MQDSASSSRLVAKLQSSMTPGVHRVMKTLPKHSSQVLKSSQPVKADLDVLDTVMQEVEGGQQSLSPAGVSPVPSQPALATPPRAVTSVQSTPTLPNQTPPQASSAQPQAPLDDDSSVVAQALPTAVTQVADYQDYVNLNPPAATKTGKEQAEATTPDQGAVEAGATIQYVEHEPQPEIPPEVDGYIKRVQDHATQVPQEIVLADENQTLPDQKALPSTPVVVLPITEETEQKAKFKSPKFSIRWLVEWSHKIIKKFVGKVVYRS